MPAPCDQIELFADGELSPQEAEAFRAHLPGCQRCQVQLSNLLVLERLAARYVARPPEQREPHGQPPSTATASRRRPPARWHLVAIGAVACILVTLFVLTSRSPVAPKPGPSELAWNPNGRALTTPRMSDPRADRYRPRAPQSMGDAHAQKEPPDADFRLLRDQDDLLGLAAAYVAWNRPQEALALLEKDREQQQPKLDFRSPNVRNDLAATQLAAGNHEVALNQLERLLADFPEHPQARWNRALAFEALGLRLLAAREFQDLARTEQEDRAREAGTWAGQLVLSARAMETRWRAMREAGESLVVSGRLPEDSPVVGSPILRLYFYDAVRTRTSREEVRLLLPLAEQLDSEAGGQVLQQYVDRISRRDFSRRGPLAREYARLRPVFRTDPQARAFLSKVLRSGEDDLALGAILHTGLVSEHLDDFEALARTSQDPWFEVLATQKRADALIAGGDFWSAEGKLQHARRLCEDTRVTYRCVELELDLAYLYARLLLPDEVQRHARQGWVLARRYGLRGRELQFLEMLAKAARLRNDVPVARAYLHESLERIRGDAPQERYIHQSLAHLELHALDFDRARQEIDRARATGLPLTLDGAGALSDIARQRRSLGDEELMDQAIAEAGTLRKGEFALALHYQGRFYVEQERAKGQGLLRDAIREAEKAGPQDENAQHARTYSYTSLILDAAKGHDFDNSLKLFGEELGLQPPERCVLAITADSERSLLVVRGDDGALRGYYDGARTKPLPMELTNFLPGEALAALRSCDKVEVLARPPLQGRSGLLPPDIAWSYRTRREAPRPQTGKSIHLVVKNVEYDPERKLEKLNWNAEFGPDEEPRLLEGALATPSQVLRDMATATEIDLATHGRVSPVSDAAYLVLSREHGNPGTDELWVRQLRRAKLKGAPLVVLAACHGGHTAPVLHEPVSLPNALLEAGARAVLAATWPILDQEASEFFNAVRGRIRQGASPAAALRDERVEWRARPNKPAWLDSVLLFE
ncbi:hypothetical protein BO221_16495 [Archangium sp. Cb G35]|uniref:CHAT domain-containing protein n=1 Tax=Archangium sp. Cb G35 TaxID=1920190 RepID=UPI0009359ADE|nr:CHAT domain-containing protein [Archangium sp. Cb G35]OJT23600.1 hypothetical protein BO221_16495 [Archangium sp. Cb G35]